MDFSQQHININKWYQQHGRHHLPWRNTNDAFHIYISEVMLQQTQVKTVLERFYFPFLEQFPTLQALANAPLEKVIKAWEGLGYYNRARNFHKAAQLTRGRLPESVEGLMALPGIGKNTAHAIAAFAFRQPVPVMEANVKRILSRVFAYKIPSDQMLWDAAFRLLNKEDPFNHNQAMMDIGALICTPKTPACALCPLKTVCKVTANPESYPQPKTKKATAIRKRIIVIEQNNHHAFLVKKREGRFLHGMYGFSEYESMDVVKLKHAKKLGAITHSYSHFKLEADVYMLPPTLSTSKNTDYYSISKINDMPLSGADKKVLALLKHHLAQ